MDKKSRLIGIDLLRGIATYAVIILHSDEGIVVKPLGWTAIAQFSSFAVPFFLATSFYLAIDRLYISDHPHNLKLRLTRLLIPYGFWSAVYLLQKIIKYAIKNDFDKLLDLFQDPVALIFFGGAAFHLYFLPLLLIGTIANQWIGRLIKKKININYIVLLSTLSLIVYQILLISGNSFRLDLYSAFQVLLNPKILDDNPLLRLLLVELSWVTRCTPYIFTAMILTHPTVKTVWLRFVSRNLTACTAVMLLLNMYGSFLPESVYEVTRGYAPLLVAICLSANLPKSPISPIISNLGSCSFGIYLIHLLVVEALQSLAKKIYADDQISVFTILIFAELSFFISWILVYYLSKRKALAKLMFGI